MNTLGSLFLGRTKSSALSDDFDNNVNFNSKNLTTHAVCVGMTGSGKTGLCLSLIEEALMDKIPVIAIDPKGDLSNLLLRFPELKPNDFKPWVSKEEADHKNLSVDDYAKEQSQLWSKGLKKWDQDGETLKEFDESHEPIIWTPGGDHGLGLHFLKGFHPPEGDWDSDELDNVVQAWLGYLGYKTDGDTILSESVFLNTLIGSFWDQNKAVTFEVLIENIFNPPIKKIGVLPIDEVINLAKRKELAIRFNNFLSSSTYRKLSKGSELSIDELLYNSEGTPRLSILSISHLSEKDRMVVVSQLLNELVFWVRKQEGTSRLRALLYMDEIYGYCPPSENPPSKKPLLTLLKQARAQGLGVVLATQNPVDLDYKGLSNTGTWFVGKLQTQRDQERLKEGLTQAGSADAQHISELFDQLDKRVFLLHSVHEKEPQLFHTRWALSYLRGPLAKDQISKLMQPHKDKHKDEETKRSRSQVQEASNSNKPLVANMGLEELYWSEDHEAAYKLNVLVSWKGHFAKRGHFEDWMEKQFLLPIDAEGELDYSSLQVLKNQMQFSASAQENSSYKDVQFETESKDWVKDIKSNLKDWCYETQRLTLFECESLKLVSNGETKEAFSVKVKEALDVVREEKVSDLTKKYETKLKALEKKIKTLEGRLEKEKGQVQQQKLKAALNVGMSVLSTFMGKKVGSGALTKAGSAVRGWSRSQNEQQDVARVGEQIADETKEFKLLEEEMLKALEAEKLAWSIDSHLIEEIQLTPRKSDLNVDIKSFVWVR